jgi:tRNA 2-thiocytidine biosynthesis protein TtcA
MDEQRRQYEASKLQKRLRRLAGRAIADFDMIRGGDRVMVCLSGGKDSYALLDLLLSLKAHAPVEFEVFAFHLDQKHPGYPAHVLPDYLSARGVPFRVVAQDTYSVVKRVLPEGATMCGLCSRLRRGVVYRVAKEMGATRSRLATTATTCCRPFFSICSSPASSRPCRPSW